MLRGIPLNPSGPPDKRSFRCEMGTLTAERYLAYALLSGQSGFHKTRPLDFQAARSDFNGSTSQKRIGFYTCLLRAESERRVKFSWMENAGV